MKNTSRLTITEAIALSGISRSQFYSKYINNGRLSKSKDAHGKLYIEKSELYRVFPDIKTVEESTDCCSKINTLEQQCVLLELENKYLKVQLEHYKLLEQKSFEREKSLQLTINHYQQSLPNPDKKHKSDKKKHKKTKKNKR
jgi:hypothetical protein